MHKPASYYLSSYSFWCLSPSMSSPQGHGDSRRASTSLYPENLSWLVQTLLVYQCLSLMQSSILSFNLPSGLSSLFRPLISLKCTFLTNSSFFNLLMWANSLRVLLFTHSKSLINASLLSASYLDTPKCWERTLFLRSFFISIDILPFNNSCRFTYLTLLFISLSLTSSHCLAIDPNLSVILQIHFPYSSFKR